MWALLRMLPANAPLWAVLDAAEREAQKPKAEQIKDRAAYWAARGNA